MAQITGQVFHVFYSWDIPDPAPDAISGAYVPGPVKECVVITTDESLIGSIITADDSSAPAGGILNIRETSTEYGSSVPIYN